MRAGSVARRWFCRPPRRERLCARWDEWRLPSSEPEATAQAPDRRIATSTTSLGRRQSLDHMAPLRSCSEGRRPSISPTSQPPALWWLRRGPVRWTPRLVRPPAIAPSDKSPYVADRREKQPPADIPGLVSVQIELFRRREAHPPSSGEAEAPSSTPPVGSTSDAILRAPCGR